MKKLSFFPAVIILLIAVVSMQSCQSSSKTSGSKMFKFNLEQGKGYDYKMRWDLDTKAGGQTSSVGITALYSMNVTGNEGGVRTIATSYKSFKMNMDVMGMQMEMDSDKPLPDNGETDVTKNPLGMMNKMVRGLVGKEFLIKVNEEGKVLDITGFESIINGMIDSLDLDENVKAQVKASMKDQFSDQTIRDQFAQVFTIFPNKEIKVGDSWEKNYSTGGRMAARYSTTYKVKEIEGDHVTLTTSTKISSTNDNQEMEGTQTGNIIVDSKTGLMINAEFDQDIQVKAEGQNVSVIGKGKISGTAH